MAPTTQIYVATDSAFFWAAELQAIANGFLRTPIDRGIRPFPQYMVINLVSGKATYSYKKNTPPVTRGAVVATTLAEVQQPMQEYYAEHEEPTPPPPPISTFGNITQEFGTITQTFGAL